MSIPVENGKDKPICISGPQMLMYYFFTLILDWNFKKISPKVRNATLCNAFVKLRLPLLAFHAFIFVIVQGHCFDFTCLTDQALNWSPFS
jgi:hypothetical protein